MKELEKLFGTPLIPMVLLSIAAFIVLLITLWIFYKEAKIKYRKEQRWTREQSRRLHDRSKN